MILLRHGQSEFNLHFTRTRRDPGIIDPGLTPVGLAQAEAAGVAICDAGATGTACRISRIIVSPYRRALQTAAPAAARLGLKVTVSSLVRERYAFACDIGSPRSTLEREWPDVDFSMLDEIWWHDGATDAEGRPARESEDSVIARADRFRAQMIEQPDWADTLVVAHWGFLLAFSGRSLENGHWLRIDPTVKLAGPVVWQH